MSYTCLKVLKTHKRSFVYAKYFTLIIIEILSVAYFPNFSITWYRAGKYHILSGRNKNQPFFKDRIFYRLLHCCPIENVWEIWPIKIYFGLLNAEIGQKMANSRLLFLALHPNTRNKNLLFSLHKNIEIHYPVC